MDALQQILRDRPVAPDEIEAIDVEIPEFLTDMVPIHEPRTGLQAKYSLEYDLAAIALDGRAGIHQYTDDALAAARGPGADEAGAHHPGERTAAEPGRPHAHER